MKRVIILTSIVLLVANLLCGALLSAYSGFNLAVSSAVIIATALLLYLTATIRLKDGFRVSLLLLFAAAGVVEYILSLLAPPCLTDNWWLILAICLLAAEALLLIITHTVSTKN